MNGADNGARLEALSREYASLNAALYPIQQRMDQIKDEFRALLDYGNTQCAGQLISIQHNPRFDTAAFAAAYPPATHGHLYKYEPDRKAIRQNLSPADIHAFESEGTPKVVVTR
jgi:hypothetical protein